MERRIDLRNLDLDRALAIIESRRAAWEAAGLRLRPLTWMDNEADWPRPLVTNRAEVQRPMSLGLRMEMDDGSEVEVVIYAGGWADISVWRPGEEISDRYEELEDAEDLGPLLDGHLARLLG